MSDTENQKEAFELKIFNKSEYGNGLLCLIEKLEAQIEELNKLELGFPKSLMILFEHY